MKALAHATKRVTLEHENTYDRGDVNVEGRI